MHLIHFFFGRYLSITKKILRLSHSKKKILVVVHEFVIGGAQIVGIRLANAFLNDYDVYLYCARPNYQTDEVKSMISPNVRVLESTGTAVELRSYIVKFNIDIIHSHIWWSDKLVYKALQGLAVKWIITLHNCYTLFYNRRVLDDEFLLLVHLVVARADAIIYLTDSSVTDLEEMGLIIDKKKMSKIYSGFNPIPVKARRRNELAIDEKSFVFGVVSRALAEKGWEESIQAIVLLRELFYLSANLILVGEGDYADILREKYDSYPYIHFVGASSYPGEWIQLFDIGLLPSHHQEALPTTIVEYLAYETPVLATDVGEVRHMVVAGDIRAGVVFPLNEHRRIDQDILIENMLQCMQEDILSEMRRNTRVVFKKFNMHKCIGKYKKIIRNL